MMSCMISFQNVAVQGYQDLVIKVYIAYYCMKEDRDKDHKYVTIKKMSNNMDFV